MKLVGPGKLVVEPDDIQSIGARTHLPRLAHHHYAHAVAGFNPLGRWHVVRSTHGIATKLTQHLKPKRLQAVGQSHTHTSVILVVAGALYLERLAVQQEPLVSVEHSRANAEAHAFRIAKLSIRLDSYGRRIKIRRIHRPQGWISQLGALPTAQVQRVGLGEPHVAIDARALVKPTLTEGCIHPSYNAVGLVVDQEIRQVETERNVTILTAPDKAAIHENQHAAESSIELNRNAAATVAGGNFELTAIPAYAGLWVTLTDGLISGEFLFLVMDIGQLDRPVVRQVQSAPL